MGAQPASATIPGFLAGDSAHRVVGPHPLLIQQHPATGLRTKSEEEEQGPRHSPEQACARRWAQWGRRGTPRNSPPQRCFLLSRSGKPRTRLQWSVPTICSASSQTNISWVRAPAGREDSHCGVRGRGSRPVGHCGTRQTGLSMMPEPLQRAAATSASQQPARGSASPPGPQCRVFLAHPTSWDTYPQSPHSLGRKSYHVARCPEHRGEGRLPLRLSQGKQVPQSSKYAGDNNDKTMATFLHGVRHVILLSCLFLYFIA